MQPLCPVRDVVRHIQHKLTTSRTSVAAVTGTVASLDSILPSFTPPDNALKTEGTLTDVEKIISTIQIVDQKAGATTNAPPNQPPPPTTVTAIDGELANSSVLALGSRRSSGLSKRLLDGYQVAFEGTGLDRATRDGSIEGTAYLTYTIVSNSTYNVDDCLRFCDRVPGCGEFLSFYSI